MVTLRKGKKEVKVPKHRVDFYLGQHYKIVEAWEIDEAFTIIYKEPNDIKSLGYSPEQEKHIDLLYKELKKRHDTPLYLILNQIIKAK